jgi:uncharacterized damage-inducible protein DinB
MEATTIESTVTNSPVVTITPDQLLTHWQEHRRVTRRTIEAFPETELFSFSIGGMRTFAQLVMEVIDIAGAGVKGIATGDWSGYGADGEFHSTPPATKAEILQLWDTVTEQINSYWPQIRPERFQENDIAFGQYEGIIYSTLLYFIDNEIHHRAQGYVYLRALNIQPPFFWERS